MKKSPRSSLTGRVGFWLWMAFTAAALASIANVPVSAQDGGRKIRLAVQPEYPDLAKRNNISGTARVQATIAPDGTVKEVKGLGGNPVLLQAATEAVKKWKYEPAQTESIAILKFDFRAPN